MDTSFKPHSSPWFSAACAAAIIQRDHLFCLYQQNKSSESKIKFRQASNCCRRVLEAAKLAYATKTKESFTSQKLGSWDFHWIANSVSTKVNLLYCIPVVVQKNCEPELSFILAELLTMGNSMSNHPGHDTLTSQVLFIFSLIVDNVEMINPWKF